jgi:HEAT repeat protein
LLQSSGGGITGDIIVDNSAQIFLSYRSADVDFALRLAADLKNAGINLWMDRMDIKPGDDWPQALEAGVNNCAAMIVLVSEEYVKSKYCLRELHRADRMNKKIFPVVLAEVPPHETPMELERAQHISFMEWHDDSHYQESLTSLIDVLSHDFPGQPFQKPGIEEQYITSLIAKLGTQKANREYSDLELDDENLPDQQPYSEDLWQHTDAFVLLPNQGQGDSNRVDLNDVREAVERYPRFMLVGSSGTGKTNILLRLAMISAHRRMADPNNEPVPVLVWLVEWEDGVDANTFITSHYPDMLRYVPNQQVALFLDGLDELRDTSPKKAQQLQQWLAMPNSPERVVMTCRTADKATAALGWPHVMIEEMDEDNIRYFISKYLDEIAAAAFAAQMIPQNELDRENPFHLFSMARMPYFLSALISVYRPSAGDLPETLGDVLSRMVRQLWRWVDIRQRRDIAPLEEMEAAYSKMALAMLEAGITEIGRSDAMEYLGEASMVQLGEDARLLDVRSETISFYHPLIAAYFAVKAVTPYRVHEYISAPLFDTKGRAVVNPWDALAPVGVGLSAEVDEVLFAIAQRNPYLALNSTLSGNPVAEATQDEIMTLAENAARADSDGLLEASRLLIRALAYDRAVTLLVSTLRYGRWPMRETAAKLICLAMVKPLPELVATLRAKGETVHDDAAAALDYYGDTAWPVIYNMLAQEKPAVKQNIVATLGKAYDRAGVPGLVIALQHDDKALVKEVITALGLICDPDVLPVLIDQLRNGVQNVRSAAAQALSQYGIIAANGLIDQLSYPEPVVRRLSIKALGSIGGDAIIPGLARGLGDSDANVRAEAIKAIDSAKLGDQFIPELIACLRDTAKPSWGKKRICDLSASLLEASENPEAQTVIKNWRTGRKNNGINQNSKRVTEDTTMRTTTETSASQAKSRLARDKQQNIVVQRIAMLKKRLADKSWEVRKQAVEELATVGEPALPLLVSHTKDPDEQVRLSVVKSLARIRIRPAIDALITMLQDSDGGVVDAAGEALAAIGRVALPGLVQTLKGEHLGARAEAIETLGKIGDEAAVPHLIPCLQDDRKPWLGDPISQITARALRQIATEDALNAVTAWEKRQAKKVGKTSTQSVAPVTSNGVEPDAEVPEMAVNRQEILPRLVEAVRTAQEPNRDDAAKALRNYAKAMQGDDIGDEMVKPLIINLKHPDWHVRWAMAEALGWIHGPSTAGALTSSLDDPSWMVRVAVIHALVEMKDRQAVSKLVRMVTEDPETRVREVVVAALGVVGDQSVVPTLINTLRDRDEFVRRVAADSLGMLKAEQATDVLMDALNDPSMDVRMSAIWALGQIKAERAVPSITVHLADETIPIWETETTTRVCDVAAEALELIGTEDAMNALSAWRERTQIDYTG